MLTGSMTGGPGSLSLLQSAPPSSSRPDDAALKKDAGQLLDIPYSPLERSLFSPASPVPVDIGLSSTSFTDIPLASLSRSSSSSSDTSTGSNRRRSRPTPQPLVLHSSSSWSEAAEDDNRTARTFITSPSPLTAVPGSPSRSVDCLDPPTSRPKARRDMPSTWEHQRARSPLAEGPDPVAAARPSFPGHSASPRPQITHRNVSDAPSSSTPPPHLISAPQPVRSPSYSHTVASPCFVHSHLDHSLSDFVKRDVAPGGPKKRKERREKPRAAAPGVAGGLGMNGLVNEEEESETASEGVGSGSDEDEDEQPSLTRQLAETAVSVREMSKQLGRARVVSHIQSVMIITKARDNHLIRLTRELALWLMQTPRNGRDRGLVVYVDTQLRKSKRFDAEGLERDNPALFRPLARRYSRTSSTASLSASAMFDPAAKRTERMTPMSQLNDAFKRAGSMEYEKKRETDEGQLRYWTNEMCTKSPQLFDFVVTLGGDGTVLYASWLFQHVVPPVIPFALGSLGFLTNFDFSTYAHTLNNAIDNGIRVNLRMRFTCTVYRAVEGDDNKKRRAVRSGQTGEIFMKSLTKAGWEAIESGGVDAARESGRTTGKSKGKDKEIKCFSTRPVESFEVLNDLVVDRGPSPYVSLLELFGDEHHMTTVQADGLTVSTPTGSTAYSLSAGGSLVHPEIPALLITPICPHTLSFRPMLLPDSMELRICVPYHSRATAWASFDGRGRVELKQGDHIKVTASAYPFPTVCADKQSTDWFLSIARTLKWNERQRQKSFVILEEERKKPRDVDDDRRAAEKANSPDGGVGLTADSADHEGTEEEDDDDDDDLGEEEEEEEGFDIDDLSSDQHTNSSSPVTAPHDPSGVPPPLSRLSTMSSPASTQHPHQRDRDHSSSSSTADLPDSNADRFHDRPPHPPRLSARHSHNGASAVYDRTPISAPPHINSHRLSAATMRRRERGEEGDRDHMHEQPVSAKKGARRRGKSLERGPRGDKEESTSRAFAVVGLDSDSSVSDSET